MVERNAKHCREDRAKDDEHGIVWYRKADRMAEDRGSNSAEGAI